MHIDRPYETTPEQKRTIQTFLGKNQLARIYIYIKVYGKHALTIDLEIPSNRALTDRGTYKAQHNYLGASGLLDSSDKVTANNNGTMFEKLNWNQKFYFSKVDVPEHTLLSHCINFLNSELGVEIYTSVLTMTNLRTREAAMDPRSWPIQ